MVVGLAWAALLGTFLTGTALATSSGEYCGTTPLLQQDAYILGASWGEDSEVTDWIDTCHVQIKPFCSFTCSFSGSEGYVIAVRDLAGRCILRPRLPLALRLARA